MSEVTTTVTSTPATSVATTSTPVTPPVKVIGVDIRKLSEYLNVGNYATFKKTTDPMKSFIAYVTKEIKTYVTGRHPSMPELKLDGTAQMQIIILIRMLYKIANDRAFDESSNPDDIAKLFAIGTLERDLFTWFAGLTKDGPGWDIQQDAARSEAVPTKIANISAEYKKEDKPVDLRFVEIVIILIIQEICKVAVEILGAKVEISETKTIELTGIELNGCFRIMNRHGQIGTNLFATIGRAADQFPLAYEIWQAETKATREAEKAAKKATSDAAKASKAGKSKKGSK